jgi:hypothetical protein
MRKIEQNMLRAIETATDWVQDNTAVIFSDHNGNPYLNATVYLHNNSIAELLPSGKIAVNTDTLKRYPTNTSKSRLRALGVNVYTKKGVTYVDDCAIG